MSKRQATLIIAASENDSNLFYATHFLVPDPIIYFEVGGKKNLVLSDLEIDRAKLEASVDRLISLTDIAKNIAKSRRGLKLPVYARIVDSIFQKKKIKNILIPANFPSQYYQALKKLGYTLTIKSDPFFEKRLIKTETEQKYIEHNLHIMGDVLQKVIVLLQKSQIKRNKIFYGRDVVTSEMLRSVINTGLMEKGCVATATIVASGVQGSYPHHEGSGPIIPHTPIIFDIFPRNAHNRYWGDMTRTMVKGRPSDDVKKMFKAVLNANLSATATVGDGISAANVHERAATCLKEAGFETRKQDGRMQGFIHSTGHGLGLDVHEPPSVALRGPLLKKGNVITIEPGLYYEKQGGIRLEDVVVVTKNGCATLTKFPKFLEID